ncbi:MAG TPA: hypothetical protein VK815_06630 [Candidatus Acidoferrales bacterium]|jgi:hypothetical protein|nr:hypothetical protein [Candidatus Acidoferrales bacterium]
MNLIDHHDNKCSQNGEDGIIAEIFQRFGIPEGWFVEFGAWDGKHLSNWSGVFIGSDPQKYQHLLKTSAAFPESFELLSNDIGSNDWRPGRRSGWLE